VISKCTNALFMSVTPRTAGFNSIDYSQASTSTNFLTILLMFIGGAPGSTAGGVKVTTIALLVLLAWSRLRGRDVVQFQGRSVPEETIQRAVGLVVVALATLSVAILILTRTERGGLVRHQFLEYMFEAFSAFNTAGLSMGATPDLSDAGRWLLILLMFVGRVGPLTFAAALARRVNRAARFRYASEDVVVG
ncbi:MAG: potassium transporter TrkG, partial [Phycisphaerales bacterium]|nr:potassium transporter TrkG [Phycisphaerales bacterium]